MCVYVEVEVYTGVIFYHFPMFVQTISQWIWSSPMQLDWLASKALASSCLPLSIGIIAQTTLLSFL